MTECGICGNAEENKSHAAREMMFGFRDKFSYLECAKCGCVQLLDMPSDLTKYYPAGYYSFQQHGRLKNLIRNQWAAYAYSGANPIGFLVTKFFMPYAAVKSVARAKISKNARILDIGCGAGNLLQDLRYLGFRAVYGADPFLDHDILYRDGPKIFKKDIRQMQGEFDLIMLHHSFEHMNQPSEIMQHLARLLAPLGRVILRIPIASSFAWKHYGVNWIHLDAPRHLYLHTVASIDLLAAQAGLAVQSLVYEGDESGFWGSEQYIKDIPLLDPSSYGSSKSRSIFTRKQIREFRKKAEELNRKHQGDLACFYLQKRSESGDGMMLGIR